METISHRGTFKGDRLLTVGRGDVTFIIIYHHVAPKELFILQ